MQLKQFNNKTTSIQIQLVGIALSSPVTKNLVKLERDRHQEEGSSRGAGLPLRRPHNHNKRNHIHHYPTQAGVSFCPIRILFLVLFAAVQKTPCSLVKGISCPSVIGEKGKVLSGLHKRVFAF